MRPCSKCGSLKSAACFSPDSRKKDGLQSQCKECKNADAKIWRAENAEKVSLKRKLAYASNPEKYNAKSKKWYAENTDKSKEKSKEWRNENRDWVNEYGRQYSMEWRSKNLEWARQRSRNYQRERRKNPRHRLEDSVKNGIMRGLKRGSKNGRSTFAILSFTVDELRIHLEALFLDGMNWNNYGLWHIDHIIPLAAHNFETPDDIDFKKAWSLSNLRPMWGAENRSKGAKLSSQFQPSLALQVAANDNIPKTGATNA